MKGLRRPAAAPRRRPHADRREPAFFVGPDVGEFGTPEPLSGGREKSAHSVVPDPTGRVPLNTLMSIRSTKAMLSALSASDWSFDAGAESIILRRRTNSSSILWVVLASRSVESARPSTCWTGEVFGPALAPPAAIARQPTTPRLAASLFLADFMSSSLQLRGNHKRRPRLLLEPHSDAMRLTFT